MAAIAVSAVLGPAGVVSLSRAEDGADKRRIDLGRAYFEQFCASCHGPEARGNGPVARSLVTPPPDLTKIAARRGKFVEAEIERIIDGRAKMPTHGTREMPVWGEVLSLNAPGESDPNNESVTKSRIMALVVYLRSIQAPK